MEDERDLKQGKATDEEIDDFIDWVHVLCLGGQGNASGKRRRYVKCVFFHDMFIQHFIFSHLKH